jgi:hypothetical protein
MSSQPVRATSGLTLRHWTIDSREFVGGPQRPALTPLHPAEHSDGTQMDRLASKLTEVKSELARRDS